MTSSMTRYKNNFLTLHSSQAGTRYPEYMIFLVDNVEKYNGYYYNNQTFYFTLDGYGIGIHNVSIILTSLDGEREEFSGIFVVFSLSGIFIDIIQLDDYGYNSSGNELIFNVSARYPGYFRVYIDGVLIGTDNYTNRQKIAFLIDNYSIGVHSITIWARALDGEEVIVKDSFEVFPIEEPDRPIFLEPSFNWPLTLIISGAGGTCVAIVVLGRYRKILRTNIKKL